MAVASMSHVVNFSQGELWKLRKRFRELAAREGDPNTITQAEFHDALEAVGVHEDDQELLKRIFILFDRSGDGLINFREFIVGVSTMLRGTVEEKLNFSFELFEGHNGSGKVSREEMREVLYAINRTVGFFGDATMGQEEVDKLVAEIFAESDTDHDDRLSYAEYMDSVARHPILVAFISRAGDGGSTKHAAKAPAAGRAEGGEEEGAAAPSGDTEGRGEGKEEKEGDKEEEKGQEGEEGEHTAAAGSAVGVEEGKGDEGADAEA